MSGPLCAARWATANRAHDEGDPCGRPASERLGDVDLCLHHFHRALDWFHKVHVREAPERYEASRKEMAERSRLIAEARSIVYFLRRESDGMIKIGTTTIYPNRLSTLRGEHGPLRLLLAIPGGRQQESEAHRAFAVHRASGEWFRPEKPLLLRILRMREAAQRHAETRLPEQVPLREIRALIREIQAAERAARAC